MIEEAQVRFDCAECAPSALPARQDGTPHVRRTIATLLRLRDEVGAFERQWPAPASATPLPLGTWEMLERQLVSLAGRPEQAAMVGGLVRSLRRTAELKPPEMVLRELLCMAWVVLDEGPPAEGA